MPTIDEYASRPREARMQRLSRTADELVAAVAGHEEGVLCRRPDARNWAPKEVGNADPTLIAANADRLAEALETFGRLTPGQWEKGAVHPALGRITIDRGLSIMAFHDDNHLDQLARALRGQP
jgi:hypothetical protein